MQETLQLPQLDISLPLLSSSLQSLSHACKEWGFFLITNHGISKELHQRLHSLCNEVFSLPLDIKLKLGPLSSIRTYTPCFIASPFFESLRVSGPNYLASAKSSIDVLFDLSNTELWLVHVHSWPLVKIFFINSYMHACACSDLLICMHF